MNIDLFGVVLFLHIAVAIVAFAIAGVLHASLQALARGRTTQELRLWGRAMERLEPLFPILAALLLGLGIWLVHLGHRTDDGFSFKDGWVVTAIVTLVAVEAMGGAVLAPHGKKLCALIEQAPDGAVSPELRAAATHRPFWHLAHLTTFGFLGVVFLMAAKPDGTWAWLFPAVGGIVGVAVSHLQLASLSRDANTASVPGQRAAVEPREART
jgi:hypothetical protein